MRGNSVGTDLQVCPSWKGIDDETLTTMRTLVRRDLKDEDSSNYRWQDNEIERAIARALSSCPGYVPREMKSTMATTDGSRDIDISTLTDRVSVDRVEFPIRFRKDPEAVPAVYRLSGHHHPDRRHRGRRRRTAMSIGARFIPWTAAPVPSPTYLEDVLALGAAAYAVLAQAQYRTDTADFGGSELIPITSPGVGACSKSSKTSSSAIGKGRKLKISQFYQGDDSE